MVPMARRWKNENTVAVGVKGTKEEQPENNDPRVPMPYSIMYAIKRFLYSARNCS